MTETEYALSRDLLSWLFYAEDAGIPKNKADMLWKNSHNIGKYLICESREDGATRLFIRNVTNPFADAYRKEGWWNTFTVTKTPAKKGLWLAKALEYRLDKNGYLNLEVEPVQPVDDIKFHQLFSFQSKNGTWESVAWWLMMSRSNAFLEEYEFSMTSSHKPNFEALVDHFADLKDMPEEEMGKTLLHRYLAGKVTLEEIEECLNTPSKWEQLISDIQTAVIKNTVAKTYGDRYPIFAKKVAHNVTTECYVCPEEVELYLQRQLYYYDELVNSGDIQPVEGEWLDKIEAALQHRKMLKDAEKAAKKGKQREETVETEEVER